MPTILLPLDLSIRADRALRRASLLAKASNARLHLLHVVENLPSADPIAVGGALPPTIGQLHDQLSRIADCVAAFDAIECDSRVVLGDPIEQIVLAAVEVGASLIVTGPYKRRLKDIIVPSTAEAVAARAHAPVLIANVLPAGSYHRILIPTGLDEASAMIARTVGDVPLGGPHELFMVYIREPLSTLMFSSTHDRDDYLREELRTAETELWNFHEAQGLTERVQRRVRLNRSTIGYEIEAGAAELGCNLIAVASSQKSFLEKLLAGSVAETIVREVATDIIVFP